jgi:hypothetical protein
MRWISAFGGTIVAAAGAVVLLTAIARPSTSGAAPSLAAPLAPPWLSYAEPSTTTTSTLPPNAQVDGLDSSVADALARQGYTDFVGRTELISQLPPSVVSALVESGVVLVVPDSGGNGDEAAGVAP